MKSRICIVLASFLGLVFAASLAYAVMDSKADVAKLESELRTLHDQRVATARKGVEISQQAYDSGAIVISDLLLAYRHLLDARLAVAQNRGDRLKALEDGIKELRAIESKGQNSSHGGGVVAMSMVAYARQTAELALLEEKLQAAKKP